MKTIELIKKSFNESQVALNEFISIPANFEAIEKAADLMSTALKNGGKILCCGNGGSLCDATHFAEELTGRFRHNRRPLPAMAINDAAYMTCVGNDFNFEDIFQRSVEAFGREDDILLAISTSGQSMNIIKAVKQAMAIGMKTIVLTSADDNPLAPLANVAICAPIAPYSDRIQEIHIKVIHILIEAIETKMGFN
jgi:D-sedoheptulose 7-phosphate isomerase